jgi:VanZ family protein
MLPLQFPRLWLSMAWLCVGGALFACLAPSNARVMAPIFELNDKVTHALGFGVLMICFAGIYPRARYAWIALGLLSLGILIELLQAWMSLGRNAEIVDVLADSIGIAAGMTVSRFWLGGWAQRVELRWLTKP